MEAPPLLRYRNREITERDLVEIRGLVRESPTCGRGELSRTICQAWNWRQRNGGLAEYACRDLLLRLQERGLVELPEREPKGATRSCHPLLPMELLPVAWLPVTEPVGFDTLEVRPTTPEERFGVRVYLERYHYLGYRPPIGEHLIHAAFLEGEPVALLVWAAAAAHVTARETYVGWEERTRRRHLHLIANNVRFLVLPWVQVKHLASKVLATSLRRLTADWRRIHGHPVWMAETFVDTSRFRGTCYRAANWKYLGQTAGRAKRGNNYLKGAVPKALFIYELHRRARQLLREGREC
jgi:hypothetical protein